MCSVPPTLTNLAAPISGYVVWYSAAGAHDIWEALTDVTRMGQWSPECTGCTWLGGGGSVGVGTRFRGSNRWGPMRWATICTIEVFDADRCFAYSARHWSGARTRWTYHLVADEAGTLISESFESVDTPAIVLFLDRLTGRPRRLKHQVRTTLARLSAFAEQHASSR
ncbi:hypothetical protein A4G26_11075 [Mycobacterium kansasii]|nr:hypothetical protein A4G26_11075 [Mycobacterium kansasii]